MSPFDDASAVSPIGSASFAWSVPDGWQQGRGAWGGLVVGALVRAVTACEPEVERTVRSVSVQILAPAVVGTHRIEVRELRRGRAMSTWSAQVLADDQVVAACVVILGSPRTADARLVHADWGTAAAGQVPPFDGVPVAAIGPPLGPVFAQHYAARVVSGVPFSGGTAQCKGWIAFAEPTAWTAASLLALVDAWWPASMVVIPEPTGVATVTFAATLLVDPVSLVADEPLLYESSVAGACEGFTSEQRRLWSADGRLVVDNLQTILVGA